MTILDDDLLEWVADRRLGTNGRIVPVEVSDLFTRCIRDAHQHPGAKPCPSELRTLCDRYGLPPAQMLDRIGRLADDGALIADARTRAEATP